MRAATASAAFRRPVPQRVALDLEGAGEGLGEVVSAAAVPELEVS